jgi:predicted acetyltransferase
MVSMYRLYEYFPNSKMIGVRLENLRKAFFELEKKLRSEHTTEADGLNEYLCFLEQFHSSLDDSKNSCKGKEYHEEQVRIQKEIGQISDRVVIGFIQ